MFWVNLELYLPDCWLVFRQGHSLVYQKEKFLSLCVVLMERD